MIIKNFGYDYIVVWAIEHHFYTKNLPVYFFKILYQTMLQCLYISGHVPSFFQKKRHNFQHVIDISLIIYFLRYDQFKRLINNTSEYSSLQNISDLARPYFLFSHSIKSFGSTEHGCRHEK